MGKKERKKGKRIKIQFAAHINFCQVQGEKIMYKAGDAQMIIGNILGK